MSEDLTQEQFDQGASIAETAAGQVAQPVEETPPVEEVTTTEVATTSGTAVSVNTELPAFMQADGQKGTEHLDRFIRPPYLKLVQKASDDELVEKFGIGTTIVKVGDEYVVVAAKGVPFTIIPLFQFTEWTTMNPIKLKGTLPMIHARSLDPRSRIAVCAKNKETWSEDIPEHLDPETGHPYQRRHVENLNYIIVIEGIPELENMPILGSFNKGRWKDGSSLAMKIRQRKAPIFGCRFQLTGAMRENTKGNFYGHDVANPVDKPGFIEDENFYNACRELHEKFDELHDQIEVKYDDEAVEATAAAQPAPSGNPEF